MGRLQPFQHLISLFLVAPSQASVPLCPLGWAVGAVPVQLRHPQVVPTLLSSMGQPAGHVWGCLPGAMSSVWLELYRSSFSCQPQPGCSSGALERSCSLLEAICLTKACVWCPRALRLYVQRAWASSCVPVCAQWVVLFLHKQPSVPLPSATSASQLPQQGVSAQASPL